MTLQETRWTIEDRIGELRALLEAAPLCEATRARASLDLEHVIAVVEREASLRERSRLGA